MMNVAIPKWTALGLLPPIDVNQPTSPERSPYTVSLKDVVMRFSTSPNRKAIMQGFLNYRAALHSLGYTSGFQWLDGSFVEEVEVIEGRVPRDLDVVTFVHDPVEMEPMPIDADSGALNHDTAKATFSVDSFILELDQLPRREITTWSAYWYSMWSHRRNQAWKGFLQVELNPSEDVEARAWLAVEDTKGGSHEPAGSAALAGRTEVSTGAL